jgi:hypothetical protein
MIADHTQKEKPMKNQQDTNNNINDALSKVSEVVEWNIPSELIL